jgi:hypothetical protein
LPARHRKTIAALFTGGILPGVVLALALAIIARRRMAEGASVDRGVATVRKSVARSWLRYLGASQRGAETHLELYGGAGRRPRHRRLGPLDLHRVPSMTASGGERK